MGKLKRLKPFYLAPLITAGILIVLFLWPSAALGVTVGVSPGSQRVVGVQPVTYVATVQLSTGESVDDVTVQIRSYTPVDLPIEEGLYPISLPPGAGSLIVDVAYQDVDYNSGYGYAYAAVTGSIVYTLTYTPPSHGSYTLTVRAEGVEAEAILRVVPPPTPTPTPVPEEEQVIIPPPAGGGAELIEPGEPARVTTPAEDIVLEIPGAFAEEPVQVVMEIIDPEEAPEPPAGMQLFRALSITAYDLLGNQTTVVTGVPVLLKVSYTDEDLAMVGGDPSKLAIMRYVPGRGWVALETTVDTANRLLIAELTTFSLFAVGTWITPGDFNVDGVVDYLDLAIFAASYGTEQGDPAYSGAADLNSDGRVNHLDLAIFAANYGSRR